jgi:hypothetical protein
LVNRASVYNDREVIINVRNGIRVQLASVSDDYVAVVKVRNDLRADLASVSDDYVVALNAHNMIRTQLHAFVTTNEVLCTILAAFATACDGLRTQLQGVTNELEASEGARKSLCAQNESLVRETHLAGLQLPRRRVQVSLGALQPIANEEAIVKQEE